MSEYSMPSYFQSMPVIGKDLSAFHEDNAAEIQAVQYISLSNRFGPDVRSRPLQSVPRVCFGAVPS